MIMNTMNESSFSTFQYATFILAFVTIVITTSAVALAIVLYSNSRKASNRGNRKLIETEDALRVSRERLQLARVGASNGLWDWEITSDLVYYSVRFKELLGYAEDEMEPTLDAWKSKWHPEDTAEALAAVEAHLLNRTPFRVRYRLKCKSGSYRWFHAQGQAMWDAAGKPTRMAGSIEDISDQIEAEMARVSSQHLYLSLVENLPVFLIRKDRDGRFTFANQAFCNLLGKTMDQILGTTDFDHYPLALAEKYRDDDRKVIETGTLFEDVEDHVDLAGHRYFEVLKTPVTDGTGKVVGMQAICWDVTDRKVAEIQLKEAKNAAELANRAKSDFLANMSHEIRTPMNAIIGMTELVLETSLAPDQRDYLVNVMESGEALLSIINEILDFSKIEAGRLQLECTRMDIREMLGSALKSLGVRAHKKGLELAWQCSDDVPRFVMGDPTRLRQIIFNLVGNAIKFTNEGEVLLSIRNVSLDEMSASLEFSVSDTGIGIAAEHQETIFDAFHQADASTTRQFGGTGLGLTISRRLVELMGGILELESSVGHGSVFRFLARFPISLDASEPPFADVSGLQKTPVLVVDDNATNRRILVDVLHGWGINVHAVASGAEALEYLNSLGLPASPNPNASLPTLITDHQMPNMDGCMLVSEIRKDARFQGMKIVLLSSSVGLTQSEISSLGFVAFLRKPVKQSELFDALAATVRTSQSLPATTLSDTRELAPLKILLAEDGIANQKLAVGLLTRWGHNVEIAQNGQEAVERWASGTFDVILMDVQMPIMDGMQASRRIRAREMDTQQHIPIIAVTAHAMSGDREKCMAAGMDGYVAKPFKKQDLYDALLPLIR